MPQLFKTGQQSTAQIGQQLGQGGAFTPSNITSGVSTGLDAFLPTDVPKTQSGQFVREAGSLIPGGSKGLEAAKIGTQMGADLYDIYQFTTSRPEFDQQQTENFQNPDLYYNQQPQYDLKPYRQELEQQVRGNQGILDQGDPTRTGFNTGLKTAMQGSALALTLGAPEAIPLAIGAGIYTGYKAGQKVKSNQREAMKQFAMQNKGADLQYDLAWNIRAAQTKRYQEYERKQGADRFRRQQILQARQGLYEVNY